MTTIWVLPLHLHQRLDGGYGWTKRRLRRIVGFQRNGPNHLSSFLLPWPSISLCITVHRFPLPRQEWSRRPGHDSEWGEPAEVDRAGVAEESFDDVCRKWGLDSDLSES